MSQRTLTLTVFAGLLLYAFVGLAQPASAHCPVNTGDCQEGGHCDVNTGTCSGYCTVNAGTCSSEILICDGSENCQIHSPEIVQAGFAPHYEVLP